MKAHVVEQVIDRIRVVVLTKFFHDISVDIGTSQASSSCDLSVVADQTLRPNSSSF